MTERLPILRFSQKELTKLFESGEAKIVTKELSPMKYVVREMEAWEKFFGKMLLAKIPEPSMEIMDVLKRAEANGIYSFELHYLPDHLFDHDDTYPGWNIKPNQWFWAKIENGDLPRSSQSFAGEWILIDGTEKPDRDTNNNSQMYKNDPFFFLLKTLRETKAIKQYQDTQLGSRFSISPKDLREVVLPELSNKFDIPDKTVRLPTCLEFNILGNIFHPEWGTKTTTEWFEDVFDTNYALCGGNFVAGGLAHCDFFTQNARLPNIGFRPFITEYGLINAQ